MLNYQNPEQFFENCLLECRLVDRLSGRVSLAQLRADEKGRVAVCKTLRDIKSGADKIYSEGKPNEHKAGGSLSLAEWERKWNAWAASRKAAFYSRAALLLLNDNPEEHFNYFLNTLNQSHNLVFLSAANDLLQHATGVYLNGPEEDLTRTQLAQWWDQKRSSLKLLAIT